jgi:transcriptional regulator with XRE-family HTH domain
VRGFSVLAFTGSQLLGAKPMKADDNIDLREIRRKLGLNQSEFWSKLGITQSGGSRYESGRDMPWAVNQLLRLMYIERVDLHRIKRGDLEVLDALRAKHAKLYNDIKKSLKAKTR